MIFTTPIFLVFFVAFYALYLLLLQARRPQLWLVFGASLIFYASFDWRFVPLLLGVSVLDFVCAIYVERARAAGGSGVGWLLVSVISNLSVLAFFKYVNFFLSGIESAGTWLGFSTGQLHLDVVLPVGISFYTFQSMSYTIDVFLTRTHARRDPLRFLTGLSFFPHLLAGPIVRGQKLVTMFETGPVITLERVRTGILLVGLGLFKKTIADMLGPITDDYFAKVAEGGDLVTAWTASLAFAAQVYGDFAGYTDIAIGLALILGYDFPQNFNLPFLATSPADYWRRWHISLSTWFRDYLFVPLVRSRRFSMFVCVLITMGLTGLWHGAAMKYIVFGVYHGVLVYISNLAARRWGDRFDESWKAKVAGVLLTFNLVLIGNVIFRAATLGDAWKIVTNLYAGSYATPPWATMVDLFLAVAALIVCHFVDWLYLSRRNVLLHRWVLPIVLYLCFVVTFGLGSAQLFVYFAF